MLNIYDWRSCWNNQELEVFRKKKQPFIYAWKCSNYASLVISFWCVEIKLHEDTGVLKNKCSKNFANFSGKGLRWHNFVKERLQCKCSPLTFLRTPFSTEQLRRVLFKIYNSSDLFKDVSAISLALNQSLITCNSHDSHNYHNLRLTKTRSDRAFCNRFSTSSLHFEIWSKHFKFF